MRRSLIALSALLAAAALGAIAANGIAGGDSPTRLVIDPDRDRGLVAVEPASGAAGSAATDRARSGKPGAQIDYFQTTQPFEVAPATEEAATLPCPKGYKAVGGYFVTGRAGTFLDLNAPEVADPPDGSGSSSTTKPSQRNWVIGVFNSTPEPDQVRFGVVCIRKR